LDQAIARVTFREGDAVFTREIFSSAPSQALVVRLTGNNTYSGLTTVADGGLAVNGSIPGDVFVWGGVLGGSGRIGGSVLNQAIVSPGNSPGTLTIAGDYSQAASGFLVIQVASASVYDRLLVGGQAHLDGGVLIQYLNGFQFKRGDTFNFLTAAGGIFGQFSQIVFPSNTMFGVGLEYTADGVALVPIQFSFARSFSGLTPNQQAVAKALDKVVNDPKVAKLVDQIDSLLLDAGVTVQINARVGVYAFYTGDLGRQNYSSNSVLGGVKMSF